MMKDERTELKSLFAQIAPPRSDDELLNAVLERKAENMSQKNSRKLKKGIVLPIAAAACLAVAEGIFAANSVKETPPSETVMIPELSEGNYYLNGDKSSGIYLCVKDNTISLKGQDLSQGFEKQIIEGTPVEISDDELSRMIDEKIEEYSAENEFVVSVVGLEDVPYAVLISWDKTLEVTDGRYAGYGYFYDGEKTLSFTGFGDFILV